MCHVLTRPTSVDTVTLIRKIVGEDGFVERQYLKLFDQLDDTKQKKLANLEFYDHEYGYYPKNYNDENGDYDEQLVKCYDSFIEKVTDGLSGYKLYQYFSRNLKVLVTLTMRVIDDFDQLNMSYEGYIRYVRCVGSMVSLYWINALRNNSGHPLRTRNYNEFLRKVQVYFENF